MKHYWHKSKPVFAALALLGSVVALGYGLTKPRQASESSAQLAQANDEAIPASSTSANHAVMAAHAASVLPGSATIDTTPHLIVLNSADANISIIDTVAMKELQRVAVGKEPHHLMATPDRQSLIVANAVGNDLVLMDPANGKVQRRIPNIDDPYQIGFSPDKAWFVANALRLDHVDLYRFDGQQFSLAKRIKLPSMPSHMVFSADSRWVFVTLQGNNKIAAIDLQKQEVVWQMPVGPQPAGIAMTPDQRYLLVGIMGRDYVEVIDWQTRQSIKKIRTGQGAHNFRSVGDQVHRLVSNRVSNTVSIIDQQQLSVVGEIAVPGGPDCMEVSADGKTLWVTSRWKKQVVKVDLPSRTVVATIPVGRSPHGLYWHDRAPD